MTDGLGLMAARWFGALVCVLWIGLAPISATAMPGNVAISAGSFFAAAARCETQNLITPAQSSALMQQLSRYLSPSDQVNIKAGYQRGARDNAVYVVQHKRWKAFVPDETSCDRVQGVLDDYRAQLGTE